MILTKICPICGKEFRKPYHRSLKNWNERARFCSIQCRQEYKKSEENRNLMRQKMIGNKYGRGNKGRIFKKETLRKMSIARKGKPSPLRGRTLSEETKRKISETNKRKGIRPPIWAIIPKKDTKIEKLVEKRLDDLKIVYQKQVPLLGRTVVDFYIPEQKIVIYCDGEYWHEMPKTKLRDEKINNELSANGFGVFRFRGNDILKTNGYCVLLVLNYQKIILKL